MSVNTWLVEHLMCGGMRREQAERFERALDDMRPANVSASKLAYVLKKIESLEIATYGKHLKDLTEGLEFLALTNENLEKQLLLFELR